jgi:hypothetical protein
MQQTRCVVKMRGLRCRVHLTSSCFRFLCQRGESLLHIAVASGNKEMVELLLDNGATREGSEDNHASTSPLLHLAVANQDLPLLDCLIDRGFDIHGVDGDGNTALHVALRHQIPPISVNLKLITYLCDAQLDVNAINKVGGRSNRAGVKNANVVRLLQSERPYSPSHRLPYGQQGIVGAASQAGRDDIPHHPERGN